MRRRRLLGGTGIALATSTVGCLGVLSGKEALTFAADPAAAADDVAKETGYATEGPKAQTLSRTFSVAGQSREVEVTNQVTTYEKSIEAPLLGEARLGVFAAIASPKVSVAGRTFNPLADYSNDKLVGLLSSQYEGLNGPTKVGEHDVETLGSTTTFGIYEATATVKGQDVDVFVHVGRTTDGDDFVVPLGLYPRARKDRERPNVVALIGSLEHPA